MAERNNSGIKQIRGIQIFLFILLTIIIIASILIALRQNSPVQSDEADYEQAIKEQSKINDEIFALKETSPITNSSVDDDHADDPAIWYNKKSPEKSIIFGSNKKAGIHAYDLDGNQLKFVEYAKVNNIDIKQTVKLGNRTYDILAGSNRTNRTIDLFFINSNGLISDNPNYSIILKNLNPYGLCLHKSKSNKLFVFVNNKKGEIFQFHVFINNDGQFSSELIRNLNTEGKSEGMVVDDVKEILYVSDEESGIFAFNANPELEANRTRLGGSTGKNNTNISYDIEGLALLPPNYLIASYQGNFTFAIFNTVSNSYVKSFKISNGDIDGVEDADGIDININRFSNDFPNGLFVVHDGYNYDGLTRKNQNYKMIDLNEVVKLTK